MQGKAGQGYRRLTDIIRHARSETRNRECPKYGPEWLRHAQFCISRLMLEMERQDDGNRYDGHVDREPKIGQER